MILIQRQPASHWTLECEFNALESLTTHPDVQRFVAWIRKKAANFRPTSHDSGARPFLNASTKG
jgi:hypothetical protein